jgi:CHASE3 domain sensor protein
MSKTNEEHEVSTIWKEVGATLYDSYTTAAENFNEHCDDLLAMFTFLDDEKILHELRAMKASINIKIKEFQTQAAVLRSNGE